MPYIHNITNKFILFGSCLFFNTFSLFTRKMQGSTATDLASKAQGVSDSSNVKVKVENDDRSFQSETKVRCVCGNQLETESMIQVVFRF